MTIPAGDCTGLIAENRFTEKIRRNERVLRYKPKSDEVTSSRYGAIIII